MRSLLFLLCVVATSASVVKPRVIPWEKLRTADYSSTHTLGDSEIEHLWRQFLKNFKPNITTVSATTSSYNFVENVKKIWQHNQLFKKDESSFEMGINEFSDMNLEEFRTRLGYNASLRLKGGDLPHFRYLARQLDTPLPESHDWRSQGLVTPVKNQGRCGSCWAFSTTGSIEGQLKRKSGQLVSLSEQQLVDCSTNYNNLGCNGGLMDNAFEYIQDAGGIQRSEDYPYVSGETESQNDQCGFDRSKAVATVTGFVDVDSGNEEELRRALYFHGPISIAIDAGQQSFMSYHSGIYDDPRCQNAPSELNHAVLLVGYGVEKGVPYWIVKNSWGPNWGESGYIRMRRNKNNLCGVATASSFPLVEPVEKKGCKL
ncbi:unnamed protein product [Schistocephalus solidus]|uniref:Cathepsin L n=1 Tax=Schistocephalus solidus TaxID=70667 RepID=A0A183T8C8_SCHSO|nr:unnamed protein product [Schistocephalus solidus]